MIDRSAVDTIRGYFYQFDMSILSLLKLDSDDDSMTVEGIEDIDLKTATDTTAVQCKYYEKTEYNHSVIKGAVMYMLSHFKEVKGGGKPRMSYAIRGHYGSGQEKLSVGIDVEFLKKNFLTYTTEKVKHHHHEELGLTDDDLAEFLQVLTLDINSLSFDQQLAEVIGKLKASFGCSPFAAEFFYYNNALRVIKELSISPDPASRKISKKVFLEKINTSSILFNEWFVQIRGKKQHLAALREQYFSTLNVSPFERFFLVEVSQAAYVRDELKEFIFLLSKKWAKLSKHEPTPFCPYLFIHGIPGGELLELKKEMMAEGFRFVDGYDYFGADFSSNSITQKASSSNGVKIKLLNSANDLTETVNSITKTRKLYQFYFSQSYFELTNPSVSHVKIQIENFNDIKGII